jgi:hypothetical protein
MKYFVTFYFSILTVIIFSQTETKSVEKRHSIGVGFNPISFERYALVDYPKTSSNNSGTNKFKSALFKPIFITYQYRFSNAVKLRIEFSFYSENIELRNLNPNPTSIYIKKSITGKIDYLSTPVYIRIFPSRVTRPSKRGGFYFDFGIITDFIYGEHFETNTATIAGNFSPPTLPSYVSDPYKESVNYTNMDFGYNRTSLGLGLGHELEFNKISFWYGLNIQFKSFYQAHNTLEYVISSKYRLMNLGFNYRF